MENASDDFPQEKKLESLLPNLAGSSPPISPKTSPTSLWKSLVLSFQIVERVAFSLRGNLFLQGNSYLKSTLRLLLRRRV